VAPLSGSDNRCQLATTAPLTSLPPRLLPNTSSWQPMTTDGHPGQRRAENALKELGHCALPQPQMCAAFRAGFQTRCSNGRAFRLPSHSWTDTLSSWLAWDGSRHIPITPATRNCHLPLFFGDKGREMHFGPRPLC